MKKIKLILLLLVTAEIGFLLYSNNPFTFNKSTSLSDIAKKAIEACRDAPFRPSCYDKKIPKLTTELTMEEAFKVTGIVQSLDPSYAYCHVLGHELSAREVRKDPSAWRDVLTRCPSGMCSNGCLHGGLQEKFRGAESLTDKQVEDLIPEFETLCESRDAWNPTGLEQASCYHAIGHLSMYAVSANIDKALSICDRTALKTGERDWRQVCYDGVFMQIFQPLEPEDFALVKGKQPTKDTVEAFCEKYESMPKASCQSESWPLFLDDFIDNPDELVRFCSKTEKESQARCYAAIVYVLTSRVNLDSNKMMNYCSKIIPERQPQCFANAASRMIEVDFKNIAKAVKFCESAKEYDPEGACFDEMVLYSDYNFHKGSPEFYKLCNSLPGKWKVECLND